MHAQNFALKPKRQNLAYILSQTAEKYTFPDVQQAMLHVQQAMLHVQQAMLHVQQAMLRVQQAMLHVQQAMLRRN